MTLKNVSNPTRKEKLGGTGEGSANTYPVNIPDQIGAFIMATRIELDSGASVGYHKHVDNEEVYFIMSGSGLYTEEGADFDAKPGDLFLCRRGNSHGIKNSGKDKLVFGAAIAKNTI